ncbi:MAG TPA: hypothetical protein VGH46_07860 [Gaiellaceae bacterium]|jgi:hypothetical protein
MRRSLLGSAVAALALAAPAAAGLPQAGALVPGRSLGGISLREPARAVHAELGTFYGACRDCARQTWYFTYRPFGRRGLAVEFARGRVSAVYTLWRPARWHGPHRLVLGAPVLAVHRLTGASSRVVCPGGYEVLVSDSAHARTAYYLYGGKLWGFGLFARGGNPCR